MRKHKVANGVRALDVVRVAVEGGQEPRVVAGDEVVRFGVRPQDVFVVGRVQVDAGLLGGEPARGDGGVDVGLVDYFGDAQWGVVGGEGREGGVGEGVERDGVGGGVFDEECKEGGDAVEGEEEEGGEEEEEDEERAPHCGLLVSSEAVRGGVNLVVGFGGRMDSIHVFFSYMARLECGECGLTRGAEGGFYVRIARMRLEP